VTVALTVLITDIADTLCAELFAAKYAASLAGDVPRPGTLPPARSPGWPCSYSV
jgi:hypothetical protein